VSANSKLLSPIQADEIYAAADLGSNSFHLVIARVRHGQLQIIDRVREMVRLADGLSTTDGKVDPEVTQRALAALERFGQRLCSIPDDHVRVVGTYALRKAQMDSSFLRKAQQVLDHSIEVVSGHEEARLIFSGVYFTSGPAKGRRMIIDIGGGSTELIAGTAKTPAFMESLSMGCVDFSRRFFPDGVISHRRYQAAKLEAELKLQPIEHEFLRYDWDEALGTSGSVRAIARMLSLPPQGMADITAEGIACLEAQLIKCGHVNALTILGLSSDRAAVFPGSLAIMSAVIHRLRIKRLAYAEGAVREGVLSELFHKGEAADIRTHTIIAMQKRFEVDVEHASDVERTALGWFHERAMTWKIPRKTGAPLLMAAARLHEAGLAISHSGYQKHGAYVIANSDMAGLSRDQQALVSTIIHAQRSKIPLQMMKQLSHAYQPLALPLSLLLRLSVVLHRGRSAPMPVPCELSGSWILPHLRFPPRWLEKHPLTRGDLVHEVSQWMACGIGLTFE